MSNDKLQKTVDENVDEIESEFKEERFDESDIESDIDSGAESLSENDDDTPVEYSEPIEEESVQLQPQPETGQLPPKRGLFGWIGGLFRRRYQANINRLVMEFQPDVVELENRSVPGGARFALWMVMTLIVLAVVWSIMFKVDKIVTATGQLVSPQQPIVLQPVTLAPVKAIHKQFGDIVTAGEILAELDPTFAHVEYDQGIIATTSFQALVDRLEAERSGVNYSIDEETANPYQVSQSIIFQSRKIEYDKKVQDLELTLSSLQTKIRNNLLEQSELQKLLGVHEEIRALSERSMKQGGTSLSTVLEQKRAQLNDQRSLNFSISKATELADEIAINQKKLETFKAEWQTRLIGELGKAKQDLAQGLKNLEKSAMMKQLVDIRVPTDLGYEKFMVVEVAERSVGSVIREGEPLFKLLPIDDELELEIEIPAKDIALLGKTKEDGGKNGVRVKLNAFPFQRHGSIDGEIIAISRTSEQKGQPPASVTFYRARVRLINPDGSLKKVKRPLTLLPGMTASAEINVGERRIIDYIAYPLLRHLDESAQEP